MLKIYDQNHIQIGMLTKYTGTKTESTLNTADKVLTFIVKDPDEVELKNEYYIRNRTDEYVVKKISHKSWSDMSVTCALNLEELQGKPFLSFNVRNRTLEEAATLAMQGTGWSIGECDVDKVRSAGMMNCTALQVIENLCAAWICNHSFDTLHKRVNFYKKMGSRKGAYFMDGLNLKQITKETDTYDYYTRIIPIGAEGITIDSVNNGKNYLENHQYSKKILTCIWKDESYTDLQALKEDAEMKLKDMSKPAESYSCDVVDLAKQRKEYGILSYGLGDEVKLINRETRTLTSQRITKMVEYPENPEKNSCEFSNTTLTFLEMQEKLKKSSDIVNFVITGDGRYSGTINVSDIINLENGLASSQTMKSFNADLADLQISVANIEKNIGNLENLSQTYAEIEKGNIPDEWVDTRMLGNGSVTVDKVDVQGIMQKIFENVIIGAQFSGAYLQAPRITGAKIDAESLTLDGKDVVAVLRALEGQVDAIERIVTLEEQIQQVINALKNVLSTE